MIIDRRVVQLKLDLAAREHLCACARARDRFVAYQDQTFAAADLLSGSRKRTHTHTHKHKKIAD